MEASQAIANLEALLSACESLVRANELLLERLRLLELRELELTDDVSELGRRVAELEAAGERRRAAAVVQIVPRPALEELRHELRVEFGERLADVERRLSGVHERALRALTDSIARRPTA
jgi:hypothetical protein